MSDVAFKAMLFAREAHKNHVRKYTGNPYVDHLAEVAGITATVLTDDFAIASAWLHDCVEDCGIKLAAIYEEFGEKIGYGVEMLSDLETGNRAERKEASRKRLAGADAWVQTIKCADIISNTSSIVKHDPNFAVVYLKEKRLLLDVLDRADPRLISLARLFSFNS